VDSSNKENDVVRKKGSDYETVFASAEGLRVLADLMSEFHVGSSSHVPSDSHETAFREGERHVVLHILHKLGKRGDPSWLNDKLDQGTAQYSVLQEFGL